MHPHGQKKSLQDYAAARGKSVNGFIKRAIAEAMERNNAVAGSRAEARAEVGE